MLAVYKDRVTYTFIIDNEVHQFTLIKTREKSSSADTILKNGAFQASERGLKYLKQVLAGDKMAVQTCFKIIAQLR